MGGREGGRAGAIDWIENHIFPLHFSCEEMLPSLIPVTCTTDV